jgi:DNA primase large subunit
MHRFDSLSAAAQEAFMKTTGVQCKKFVPDKGKDGDAMLKKLQDSTPGAKMWKEGHFELDTNFYEMPFFEAHPTLIAGRKVVVLDGLAYVPSSALKLIIAGKFKEELHASLDVAFNGLPTALADPRVGAFLRLLQEYGMQLLVAPKSKSQDVGEKLSLDNFEELLVRSFPPCMRQMVEFQRDRKKHLKHQGRLQLRPFLKEVGFTIEESFRWWRQELCRDPEITATVFDKNYMYDLEHTYGKKGNFQGQNAFGCPKIIGFPGASAAQAHGCPFKQLDMPSLKQMFHRWRVPESNMLEIEKLITHGKHFQLGCIEYFKAKHPGHEGEGVGNSPQDFFRESCRCHAKDAADEEAKAAKAKAK